MRELLTQFGIDWKLLLAQVINFFILLYILRRFAYGPVMKVLADRRKKIEEGIRASIASEEKLAEAENVQKKIIHEARAKALSIVNVAEKDAEEHGKNILEAAHDKSEQVIASGQKKLEEERTKLSEEFEAHAAEFIRLGVTKVIGKIEPEDRDKTLIREALKELKTVAKTL